MRKQILMMALIAVGFLASGSNAFAQYGGSMDHMSGFAINPAISYISTTNDNGTTKTTQSNFYLDAKLDYHFMNGLYVGGVYTSNSYSTSGSSSVSSSLTGIAPLVGIEMHGFFIDVSYYVTSQYQLASNFTYKSGTGFGVDVGYSFMFDKFFVGPEFSYKALTYTQLDTGSGANSIANNYKYSEIVPFIQFGVVF